MDKQTRIYEIYSFIDKQKSVQVSTLANIFNVSQMTIRRDLKELESANLIYRKYGVAKIQPNKSLEIAFNQRLRSNENQKKIIAKKALHLLSLSNSSKIFLDGSSTSYELAKIIPDNSSLTIYTNNISALSILANKPSLKIYMIGGFVSDDRNTTDDKYVLNLVKEIYVDISFISCSGFTENEVRNADTSGFESKKILLANSHKAILLATADKYNKPGVFIRASCNLFFFNEYPEARGPCDFLIGYLWGFL